MEKRLELSSQSQSSPLECSDFSINVVQAMDRALLVDVIPPEQQATANAWASRMFGFGCTSCASLPAEWGYSLTRLDSRIWLLDWRARPRGRHRRIPW